MEDSTVSDTHADWGAETPSSGGDETQVLLVDDDETWASSMAEILEQQREEFVIHTATDLEGAKGVYRNRPIDCIVCDYDLETRTGLELLSTLRQTTDRPFILITGQGSESVASDAISQGVTDYIPKRSLSGRSDLLARRIESAVDAYRTEKALERERRSKDAMLDIVTATASRDGIAAAFCEHLVSKRDYECVWIGTQGEAQSVVPRASAGDDGYLDAALSPETPPADSTEPADVAMTNRSIHVETDLSGPAPWQTAATDHGFETAIATPILHDGSVFGVLSVYKSKEGAAPREPRLLEEYGETIGYALQSAAWRESLLSGGPVAVDLEFGADASPLVALDRTLPAAARITVLTTVPRSDTLLYVLRVDGATGADIRECAAPEGELAITESEEPVRCELSVSRPTPETAITTEGGHIVDTTVGADQLTITAVKSDDTGIRTLVDAVRTRYPDMSVGAVRSDDISREPTTGDGLDALTDKQRRALEIAYFNGYFERPREHDTTEIAEKFGVSRQTMTQHLRAGQRKLLSESLDDG
jgi:DNA-binding NarL/FixJ family response regulator